MVCLAGVRPSQSLTKQQIALREGISGNYIAQILVTLKNAGLVSSHRGSQGGFTLARAPAAISVADMVEAVDGPICIVPCVAQPKTCDRVAECVTRTVWRRTDEAIRGLLASISLRDLAEQVRETVNNGAIAFEI